MHKLTNSVSSHYLRKKHRAAIKIICKTVGDVFSLVNAHAHDGGLAIHAMGVPRGHIGFSTFVATALFSEPV